MANKIYWRFLVIDDKQADAIAEIIKESNIFESPHQVIVETCKKFEEAIPMLNQSRIDLIILDLKEEKGGVLPLDVDAPLAGEKVFEQIRQSQFVPVVFYTAYPTKVSYFKNPYVQIIRRGNSRKLCDAIKKVFETGLPYLTKYLEDEQRKYMWDHVNSYWKNTSSSHEKTDATFLLARRLANILRKSSVEKFLASQNLVSSEKNDSIYPIEMFIYPSVNPKLQVGDILKKKYNKSSNYWMIMTPSCDIEQNKVTDIILAACFPLSEQPEYKKIKDFLTQEKAPSKAAKSEMEKLICNKRAERFSFLPATSFLPDLVVDFQVLIRLPLEKIKSAHRVASLDSPFAEACSARFARYYGRLGTPDLDEEIVYEKILESIQKQLNQ